MGFSDKQVNALRRNLNGAHIRTRKIEGRELSYIEGWHAIAEANRIFGFDHWDRETVETKCVQARENRGTSYALYIAKVRVTVRAAGEAVVREGYGTGEGHEDEAAFFAHSLLAGKSAGKIAKRSQSGPVGRGDCS